MNEMKTSDVMYIVKGLCNIFWAFFKIGSITFGGGLAMLPILEEELSIKRKWTNREELLDYFAIGQTTPGIIAVNVATFVGYKRHGIIGGISGTLGMVAPSIIIITIIAAFLSNFADIEIVKKAFAGINIAVTALLIKVSFTFAKNSIKKLFQVFIAVASFSLVFILNVQTVWIIFGSITLGLIMYFCNTLPKKNPKKDGGSK